MDVTLAQKYDGFTRTYRLYVPQGYDPLKSYPVVIAIHGAFSTAAYHEQRTGFSSLADEEGFVVIYPNGIGLFGWLQHWNAGHCCGKALADDVDDVGFILATLDDAASKVSIDRTRVYVTGFSNGGMMTHRLGAERGDRFAAIAPVAGAIGGSEHPGAQLWQLPRAVRALPVMLVHGDRDDRVPYLGGPRPDKPDAQQYLPVAAAVDYWLRQNGCLGTPASALVYNGRVEQQLWQHCARNTQVQLLTVNDWRHTWPGPDDPTNDEAPDLYGFDAARVIWAFFKRYRLPDAGAAPSAAAGHRESRAAD